MLFGADFKDRFIVRIVAENNLLGFHHLIRSHRYDKVRFVGFAVVGIGVVEPRREGKGLTGCGDTVVNRPVFGRHSRKLFRCHCLLGSVIIGDDTGEVIVSDRMRGGFRSGTVNILLIQFQMEAGDFSFGGDNVG